MGLRFFLGRNLFRWRWRLLTGGRAPRTRLYWPLRKIARVSPINVWARKHKK